MKKRWAGHIFALAGLIVFSVLGLGSAATAPRAAPAPTPAEAVELGASDIVSVPWAAYTIIPSKNYTVVGTVVLRNINPVTLLGDLMERAVAMGGHDIKNVRLAVTRTDDDKQINAATAVAIRFTDETLMRHPLGIAAVSAADDDPVEITVIELAVDGVVVEPVAEPEARPRRRIWPTVLGGLGVLLLGFLIF